MGTFFELTLVSPQLEEDLFELQDLLNCTAVICSESKAILSFPEEALTEDELASHLSQFDGLDWDLKRKDFDYLQDASVSADSAPVLQKLRIITPQGDAFQDDSKCDIRLHSSLAFGDGRHPTTLMMLRNIEVLEETPRRVLDLGTGSGVLAISVAKLFQSEVLAVDTDPEACKVAEMNLQVNDCAKQVQLSMFWPQPRDEFDLLLANLFSGILLENSERIASYLKPGARVFLSGFRPDDEHELAEVFQGQGLRHRGTERENGWSMMMFQRLGARREILK